MSITLLLSACTSASNNDVSELESFREGLILVNKELPEANSATFAGGCFWCMEPGFEALNGVHGAISGYAGGSQEDATYKKVISGTTNHREAVQVIYDEDVVNYQALLENYLQQIDPTDNGGQFSDRGPQYTTAIYYHNDRQKEMAELALQDLEKMAKFSAPIVVAIEPYTTFFAAEEYHQDFYKKSADHYKRYKEGSGRADFIEENWAKEAALEFSR